MAGVVCFGTLTPALLLTVDRFPERNTGTVVNEVSHFVSDDAAIVASLLARWGIASEVIGNALGDDERGRQLVRQLEAEGVESHIELNPNLATPWEVNISDTSGARTYFWQRSPDLLATLETADLSMLRDASLLYVDWYAGSSIIRAMEEAARLKVPIFLNLECGHRDSEFPQQYVERATICQAVTDEAQVQCNAAAVGRVLLKAGAVISLVTMAERGCLAMQGKEMIRVAAPSIPVVDGCGAGATFSSGFIYGYLKGWNLEKTTRFATAAASLSCTVVGPRAFPLDEIELMPSHLDASFGGAD